MTGDVSMLTLIIVRLLSKFPIGERFVVLIGTFVLTRMGTGFHLLGRSCASFHSKNVQMNQTKNVSFRSTVWLELPFLLQY